MRLQTRLCGSVRRTHWVAGLGLAVVAGIMALALATPAEAGVINRWTAVQPTGTVGTNIPLVVRGSSPVDAYPLSAGTLKLFIDGELVPKASYTSSVLKSSIYVYYLVQPPLTDGLHAFRVDVADSSGAVSMRMWNAFVAQAPTAAWTAPAAGASVPTGSPQIVLSLSDNTPTTTFTVTGQIRSGSATGPVVATFGGSGLPAGTASFTPSAELAPGTWFATATVADAAGNVRQLTGTAARSFATIAPPAMSILGECADCHAAIVTAHPAPASTDCGVCHPDKVDDHMQGTEHCEDCHATGGAAMAPHGSTVAVRSQCTDCHNTGRPEVVQHTPASVDPEHAGSCMGCHNESLLTRHSLTPEGSSYALQCDACHASTDPAVLAAIAAGDTSCGACHTGHVEQHEVTISAGCASAGCHSGTNLVPIHKDSCAACHESTRQAVIDSIAAGNRTCESCHTAIGVDYHLNAAAAHASPTTTSCFGAGCHPASRDLAAVHEIYAGPGTVNPQYANACALCHANPAVDVSTSGARCTPACHSISTHSGYAAGHTITAASAACTVCHTGWLEGVHGFTGSNWAVCDTCHLDPGTGLKTADCASCHIDVDHLSLHDAPVSEGCAGAGCHTGTNLSPIHDSNCDGCHKSASPTVIAAIAAGDKSCTACHTTVGVDYHLNMTAAHTAPVSDYELCGGCHHGWGSSPIKGPDVLRHSGGCVTCHNATLDLTDKTAHCGSCHLTDGTGVMPEGFHLDTATFHTAVTPASESCGRCHGTNVRELHTVTTSCSTCHVTRSCAECHTPHSPMGGALMIGVECARCHPTQGTDYHVTFATDHTYAAMDPGCQAVGCHSASLVDAHAAFVGPAGRYPQYADTCALCHLNEDAERVPEGATAECSTCHASANHDSMHEVTLEADCSGCHTQNGLTGIHEVVGCGACHQSADPVVLAAIGAGDRECTACHPAQPHDGLDSLHQSTVTSDVFWVFSDHDGPITWSLECTLCHGSTNLLPVHAGSCAACHNGAKPADSFEVWSGGCIQGGCHPGFTHPAGDSGHGGIDCDSCHEPDFNVYYESCDACHNPSSAAPVTRSNVKATYTGTATIGFAAPNFTFTYYRLDGGPKQSITTVTGVDQLPVSESVRVAPPASGLEAHTIEYWSVDDGGREELPHKVASFTVFADTTMPATTSNALSSYVGPVTITLTPTDNGSTPVSETYWRLDGGAQMSGRTVSVPQPAGGSQSYSLEFWSVDASGNEELPHKTAEFTITADLTAPEGSITINSGADYATSYYVTLAGSATDVGGSGVTQMRYRVDSGAWSTWRAYAATWPGSYSIGTGQGTRTITVEYMDRAGNVGSAFDTIVYDSVRPTGTVAIAGGAATTASSEVTVNLAMTDAVSGMGTMRFSNNNSTWSAWEPYAPTKVWMLTAGNGPKTVYVQVRDNAGNQYATSDTITAEISDAIAPTGSVVIDADAPRTANTTVALTLSATDTGGAGLYQMRFSNDGLSWSAWEAFAAAKAWTIPAGDGTKTVNVQYSDYVGNQSEAYADTIVLDTTGPNGTVAIDGGAGSTDTAAVTLTLTADDPGGAGVSQMQFSNDGTSWSAWRAYAGSADWLLEPGDGEKTVYARFRDGLGNIGPASDDGITLATSDAVAPTGSIVVDGGTATTLVPTVTLTLEATDPGTSGLAQMQFSNDGTSWGAWESYATSKAWTLSTGDGLKTVYVRFRDGAGNVSAVYSDTITLNAGTATLVFRWPGGYGYAELHVQNMAGTWIANTTVTGYDSDLSWTVTVPANQHYYMVCDYYVDWGSEDEGGGYGVWTYDTRYNADGVLSSGETVIWNY